MQRMQDVRFNVFGRIISVTREGTQWRIFTIGSDGKRGPAGFVVPDFVEEADLEQYFFDLFHESAVGNGDVRRMG